jgi:hypothetical protein
LQRVGVGPVLLQPPNRAQRTHKTDDSRQVINESPVLVQAGSCRRRPKSVKAGRAGRTCISISLLD